MWSSVVPGLGTSRLMHQGTWFCLQMGILVGQGTQGVCSRSPTEFHRQGPVAWHCLCWGNKYCPQTAIQWTGGYLATITSL